MPKAPFARLVRDLMQKHDGPFRIQSKALNQLMRAAQLYLESLFKDAFYCSVAAKRSTVLVKDFQLALRMSKMIPIKNDD